MRVIFKNEIAKNLRGLGYFVTDDGDCLVVSQNGKSLAKINNSDIIYTDTDFYDRDKTSSASLSRTVREIFEYFDAYEKAPVLKANGLTEDYHCLSEFNSTVLAAKNTEYGFEFVTWERTFDNTGVTQGNYYSDYSAAKENFAIRSGLVDERKIFDVTELAGIRKSVDFALENNGALSFDENDALKKLSEKISDLFPEQRQSDAPEMSLGGI